MQWYLTRTFNLSSVFLQRRRSWANSKISELLIVQKTDITVLICFPNQAATREPFFISAVSWFRIKFGCFQTPCVVSRVILTTVNAWGFSFQFSSVWALPGSMRDQALDAPRIRVILRRCVSKPLTMVTLSWASFPT
ncbi:hypothetical protein EVAR_20346_1 [Eumeta japonica]|uniref:Uncharacterized protein n=1 Tax=Eumeta variegata TaxID=151549 RepID=A0A4C1VSP2_EUMVA|nr:hypothetical protein EVAR_20346_1 [Eumeta japonica]